MSAYVSQPIEPFYVPAKVLRRSTEGGAPGSSSTAPQSNATPAPNNPLEFLESNSIRMAAAVGFAVLYLAITRNPIFASVSIIILLGCTLFRLNDRMRRIVVAPLTFSAVMLALSVSTYIVSTMGLARKPSYDLPFDAPWLPLFLAVTLFYAPRTASVTTRIMMAGSILLLAAGLLPGMGWLGVAAFLQYLIYLAFILGVAIDVITGIQPSQPRVPANVTLAPQAAAIQA